MAKKYITISLLFLLAIALLCVYCLKRDSESKNSHFSNALTFSSVNKNFSGSISGEPSIQEKVISLIQTVKNIFHIDNNLQREKVLTTFIYYWVAEAPTKLMYALLTIEKKQDRAHAYSLAMERWYNIDIQKFEHWLQTAQQKNDIMLALEMLVASTQYPNSSALVWLHYISDSVKQKKLRKQLFSMWGASGPSELLSWAVDDLDKTERYLKEIFQVLANTDIDLAVESLHLIQGASEDHVSDVINTISAEFMGSYVSQAPKVDNDQLAYELMASIQSLPEGALKEQVVSILAPEIIEKMTRDGSVALLEQWPEDDSKLALQQWLTYRWAQEDPWAAYEYTQAISNKTIRSEAAHQALSEWTKLDIQGAHQKLTSISNPNDKLIHSVIARAVLTKNSEIATQWVDKLNDDDLKMESVAQISQLLHQQDRRSAIRFVEAQDSLSQSEKKQLINFLDNPTYPPSHENLLEASQ